MQWFGICKTTHYHPKMLDFEANLKKRMARKDESVMSVWKFPLPFAVEIHIHNRFNIAWREDASELLCIGLKASVDMYGLQNDNQAFEIVG